MKIHLSKTLTSGSQRGGVLARQGGVRGGGGGRRGMAAGDDLEGSGRGVGYGGEGSRSLWAIAQGIGTGRGGIGEELGGVGGGLGGIGDDLDEVGDELGGVGLWPWEVGDGLDSVGTRGNCIGSEKKWVGLKNYEVRPVNYAVLLRNYEVSPANYEVRLGNYALGLGNYEVSVGNYEGCLGRDGVSRRRGLGVSPEDHGRDAHATGRVAADGGRFCAALSGLGSSAGFTQGVALGWYIAGPLALRATSLALRATPLARNAGPLALCEGGCVGGDGERGQHGGVYRVAHASRVWLRASRPEQDGVRGRCDVLNSRAEGAQCPRRDAGDDTRDACATRYTPPCEVGALLCGDGGLRRGAGGRLCGRHSKRLRKS